MKKIVLVLLFAFVAVTTFAQVEIHSNKSIDGRFRANSHVMYTPFISNNSRGVEVFASIPNSLFVEVFDDDNLIGKINTSELQGKSIYPFLYMYFTKDNKKLYIGSSTQTYEYNIKTDKLTQLFVGENIRMLGIDNDGGLICCPYTMRNHSYELKTEPYNLSMKRVYWTNDNFFKCIDGVRYPIKKEIYSDKTSNPEKIVIGS